MGTRIRRIMSLSEPYADGAGRTDTFRREGEARSEMREPRSQRAGTGRRSSSSGMMAIGPIAGSH
jgi:hypothetical protein